MYGRTCLSFSIALMVAVVFAACSPSPEKYVSQGTVMLQRGKYREARTMYLHALQKNGRYGLAYAQLGLAEQKLGNPAAAIAAYRRALDLIPSDELVARTARVELADLYLNYSLNSETIAEASRTAS